MVRRKTTKRMIPGLIMAPVIQVQFHMVTQVIRMVLMVMDINTVPLSATSSTITRCANMKKVVSSDTNKLNIVGMELTVVETFVCSDMIRAVISLFWWTIKIARVA